MTLKEFIAKYQGKKIDYDGAYGAQCVDLFRYYCKEVLGIGQPKGVTGAKDFWTNYPTDPVLYNNFERIANTPDFVPQPGDVWIWTAGYGKYGHVAIESYATATTSTFQCFSQNDPAGSPCVLKNYKYKNVYGVLRPKKTENIFNSGNNGSKENNHISHNNNQDDTWQGDEGSDKMYNFFLGVESYEAGERKLIEHLGINGKKCAWGDASGKDSGGFLGSERRRVKELEAQKQQDDQLFLELDDTARDLKSRVETLTTEKNTLMQKYDQKIKDLEQELSVAKMDADFYHEERDEYSDICERLEKKNQQLTQKNEQLRTEMSGMTVSATQEYVASLESEIKRLRERSLWEMLIARLKELLG